MARTSYWTAPLAVAVNVNSSHNPLVGPAVFIMRYIANAGPDDGAVESEGEGPEGFTWDRCESSMSKTTEEELFDDDLLACRFSPQELAAAIVDAQDNGMDAWHGNIISMMQAVFGAVMKSGGHCGVCDGRLEHGKPPAQVGLVMHSSGQAFGIPLCEDCATVDDASFGQAVKPRIDIALPRAKATLQ